MSSRSRSSRPAAALAGLPGVSGAGHFARPGSPRERAIAYGRLPLQVPLVLCALWVGRRP